ncbi:MAG: DNA repair exonuclease [Bacteroidota bacterium]
MKILHFSDTHLGYSDLDKVGAKGINLREQDFYDAFEQVIDAAIELRPDLILHAGDFFHRPSPPNRPMIFALEQLNRLSDAGLPIVIIAGNHSTPKTIYTSPILQAFRTIKGVYPIFQQAYETVEFGDLVVHGLPHINDDQLQLEEMKKIQPIEGKLNVLMLHTSIGKDYIMEEFGEKLFPPERMALLRQFDYVALGHWHNYQQVRGLANAWYSGSTERMSDTEVGKEKGYCILELEAGPTEPPVPTLIPIKTRLWHRLDIKDCASKSVEDIETELLSAVQGLELEQSMLNLYLHQIQSIQAVQLSNKRIQEIVPGPVHINVRRLFADRAEQGDEVMTTTETLDVLMNGFINKKIKDEKKAKRLNTRAQYYFNLYESGEYRKR